MDVQFICVQHVLIGVVHVVVWWCVGGGVSWCEMQETRLQQYIAGNATLLKTDINVSHILQSVCQHLRITAQTVSTGAENHSVWDGHDA